MGGCSVAIGVTLWLVLSPLLRIASGTSPPRVSKEKHPAEGLQSTGGPRSPPRGALHAWKVSLTSHTQGQDGHKRFWVTPDSRGVEGGAGFSTPRKGCPRGEPPRFDAGSGISLRRSGGQGARAHGLGDRGPASPRPPPPQRGSRGLVRPPDGGPKPQEWGGPLRPPGPDDGTGPCLAQRGAHGMSGTRRVLARLDQGPLDGQPNPHGLAPGWPGWHRPPGVPGSGGQQRKLLACEAGLHIDLMDFGPLGGGWLPPTTPRKPRPSSPPGIQQVREPWHGDATYIRDRMRSPAPPCAKWCVGV